AFKRHSAGVVRCDEAECHCRAEREAAAWIASTRDARHVITDRIQTGNGAALPVQNARMAIRRQPDEGAEAPGQDPDRVKRARVDGTKAWIRFVFRVAVGPIEGGLSSMKIRVASL